MTTILSTLLILAIGFTLYGLYKREANREEKKKTTRNAREMNS